jgi:hypothetical protein
MKEYIEKIRDKFFKECVVNDSTDGLKLRIDYAPHDLFEWFKRAINAPSIDVEGVSESYKKWFKTSLIGLIGGELLIQERKGIKPDLEKIEKWIERNYEQHESGQQAPVEEKKFYDVEFMDHSGKLFTYPFWASSVSEAVDLFMEEKGVGKCKIIKVTPR